MPSRLEEPPGGFLRLLSDRGRSIAKRQANGKKECHLILKPRQICHADPQV
jgi:hypothetical protein